MSPILFASSSSSYVIQESVAARTDYLQLLYELPDQDLICLLMEMLMIRNDSTLSGTLFCVST